MKKVLYTIGYSGFADVDDFVSALTEHGIQVVIDVRSSPFSTHFAEYNKDRLSETLAEHDIFYRSFALQFGARQKDRAFYKNGRLDFETFSKSEQFSEGIEKVESSNAVIAFLCAEKHPSECHRAILVARAFYERGHEIVHIKPGGETFTQKDVEAELLDTYFPNRAQGSLFEENNLSEEEYVAMAYRLRNDEIGYREDALEG